MALERINSLSCWKNDITCQPLTGGITNQNFVVQDGASKFVARICTDRPFLGIDRRNERDCQAAASQAGISPEVVHFEDGILVSRFVEAKTLQDENLHDAAMLRRFADSLRQLHNQRDRLTGEMLFFCPFQTVRTYTATARNIQATLPDDIEELLDDSRRLSNHISDYQPTLCHNDLLAANIMDDGKKLWLVDWEYAGIGNPLFDLASIAANCRLNDEREAELIEAYFGSVLESIVRELQILKTVSLLREALWAVIQTVKSEIDFDYVKYATDNFDAYKRARVTLED